MQYVLVIDHEQRPLMPCHPARARKLLKVGKASVFRRYPFTIIFKERVGGETQPIALKLDPGSKTTGIALVADTNHGQRVVWAAELTHRGAQIKAAMDDRRVVRRLRRNRKTRYRAPRFDNRRRAENSLPPSLMSRLYNTQTWVCRLSQYCPVDKLSMELVKFDTQAMQNPEIDGTEYQQGTLYGYEVREYLLEKFGRKCVYCGAKDTPLEIEHIIPKSRGGTNRVSNLALACHDCNQIKGNQTAVEFGHPHVQKLAKAPLKDAAAVNATRWALYRWLASTGLSLEVGTGGRTKFNRIQQNYPKAHWVDAACVGKSGELVFVSQNHKPLFIKATGHGRRQMCQTDKYGFPKQHRARQKVSSGYRTGDMAKAVIPNGKYAGVYIGKVTIRQRPNFKVCGVDCHPKYLTHIHKADGYEYT